MKSGGTKVCFVPRNVSSVTLPDLSYWMVRVSPLELLSDQDFTGPLRVMLKSVIGMS